MENEMILLPKQTINNILLKLSTIEKIVRETNAKGKKEYLCYKEVEDLLKISRNTVDKHVKDGHFNKYQAGGKHSKVTFKRSEIEYFIETNRKA